MLVLAKKNNIHSYILEQGCLVLYRLKLRVFGEEFG